MTVWVTYFQIFLQLLPPFSQSTESTVTYLKKQNVDDREEVANKTSWHKLAKNVSICAPRMTELTNKSASRQENQNYKLQVLPVCLPLLQLILFLQKEKLTKH